jgi:hypothetical protein
MKAADEQMQKSMDERVRLIRGVLYALICPENYSCIV